MCDAVGVWQGCGAAAGELHFRLGLFLALVRLSCLCCVCVVFVLRLLVLFCWDSVYLFCTFVGLLVLL